MIIEKGILNRASVTVYLDVSPAQFDRWRRQPDFPKPLKIGGDSIQANKYWSVKSLNNWIASLDPNEKEPCNE